MNKNNAHMNPTLLMQGGVLLGLLTLVHLLYEGIVRPAASALVATQGASATNAFWVILKDYEQQLSITIGLYCCFLMAYKVFRLLSEETFYSMDFLQNHPKDEPLDLNKALSELEGSAYKDNTAISTWINCIQRYKNTGNVQHASDAISSSTESLAMQLEAGNSMIRYCIWAIPSIGFVGTVRGIGEALARAEQAVSGDISGMVDKLGVAFNSTLVSLLVSLVLMFFMHLLNNRQDQMVINTQASCERHLLAHLHK